MKNPLEWVFDRGARQGQSESPRCEEAPVDKAETPRSAGRERQELFNEAVEEVKGFTIDAERSVIARVDQIDAEVGRLREALDHKFESLEDNDRLLARGNSHLQVKFDQIEEGIARLAGAFDQQLSSTEQNLQAIREVNETRLEDVKASHQRHVASLEKSRSELLEVARQSQERLERHVEEAADFLERATWPAVPAYEAPEMRPDETISWYRPLRAWRQLAARRRDRKQLVARLERRIASLEDLLRERWEENVKIGRSLRAALVAEADEIEPMERADNGDRKTAPKTRRNDRRFQVV